MRKNIYTLICILAILFALPIDSHALNGYIDTLQHTICQGDTLILSSNRTAVIRRDTVFFDTIAVPNPAKDSIHMHIANVMPTYSKIEYHELVPGQTFNWCGEVIQSAGKYTKIYKTVQGCDSTFTLVVKERPGIEMTLRSHQVIAFCDSIEWDGIKYYASDVVRDTLRSFVYGCDSIVTTYLSKGTPFRHYDTDTLLIGSSLYWHGQLITEAGEYEDRHTNRYGCDSTYILRVVLKAGVPQPKVQTTRVSICDGDEYLWRGKSHSLSGTYYDTTFIGADIDSLFVLHLRVNPAYENEETVAFSTFPVFYRGMQITGAGTYDFTYTSASGCDSIIHVHVNRQVIIHEETATICAGETYEWRYQRLTEGQTYQETVKGSDGTDSVTYILHLNVRNIPTTYITKTICNGDSYVFGTKILTEAGIYRHTFKKEGCDSIVELSLNIANVDTIVQVHRLSSGESYTWPANGRSYSTAGTYEVTMTNSNGCDSIVRLVLTTHHVDTIDTTATICPGESITWHTITASQTGKYENVETDPHGDMTYYRMDLTVRELKEIEVPFTICGDESILFNGKNYNKAGHYYDKGSCDTLYHIIISQFPTQVYATTAKLDGTNPYRWTYMHDGIEETNDFDEPGTYEFTSPNSNTGCNDIWRLVLSLDDNEYHFIEQKTLCEGEAFSWRGHNDLSLVPGEATYIEHLYTRTGKDSIFELQVTVLPVSRNYRTINFCGDINWKGVTYSTTTTVYDTLTAANGCDSIETISLRKITPFFRSDTMTIIQGEQLIWHNLTITTSGIYYDKKENIYGCDSIYELRVGIDAAAPQTNMITTIAEICEGDYYEWRGTKYFNTGNYPDTVFATNIEERDTIFVLHLNVTKVERRREQYFFCEGSRLEDIYGINYTNQVKTGVTYRDTVEVPNAAHLGCPDTVYIEIYKYPKTHVTETMVLHPGDTIVWHGDTITTPTQVTHNLIDGGMGGCGIDSTLRVIADMREEYVICKIDTPDIYPFVWREDTFYTSGLWYDTVLNANGEIEQFYSLDLTVTLPYDTTVYLHGCKTEGVVWRDSLYLNDTAFIDRVPVTPFDPLAPCDSVFHVHIKMDTVYNVRIDTTLCEYQLPLIIGRINPDTIWSEGNFQHRGDTTSCGCDSIINGYLKIIPKLTRNDSTFVCESFFESGGEVILGDTVHPAFLDNDGGKWIGKWEGKWTGVHYSEDTIVWDCDSNYYHHIIMRPSQKIPYDTTYYMCEGDSVQLFWPKTQWVKRDTVYFDTVPMGYDWTDPKHQISYHRQEYLCDSVVRWTVKFVHPEHKDTTAHILIGDSLWWGGSWRYYTGDYDSIGPAKEKNSDSIPCRLEYTLHLIADTGYYFRDTTDICAPVNKTISHTWASGFVQTVTMPNKDTLFTDTAKLVTYARRDSVYMLTVNYHVVPTTLLHDTICEGDSYRFDIHRGTTTIERWLTTAGTYWDTLETRQGCDSIIKLRLYVRNRVPTTHKIVHIPDTATPYLWKHTWPTDGGYNDSTQTLFATGEYRFVMQNRFGCDSIDSLSLFVHKTYRIKEDTIIICQSETPYTWQDRDDITGTCDLVFNALTVEGYDSIRYVHIEVRPVVYGPVFRDTICEGESLRFGLTKGNQPRYLTKSGVYYDTLTSHTYGCDSIIELRLNVYAHKRSHQTRNVSVDDLPFEWIHTQNGNIIGTEQLYAEGEYSYHFTTSYGCDSIDSLSLRVHQTYLYRDTITICASETPYEWEGIKDIYTTDEYTKYLQTHDGYDSIRVRYITVLPVPHDTIRHSMCEGSDYLFNGTYYSKGGTYHDTLRSQAGCDSIVTLLLTVNKPYFNTRTEHIIEGNSIDWFGETYTQAGTYYHHNTTPYGCDSTSVLQLFVHNKVDTTVTVCSNDLPYLWTNKWNGSTTPLYTAGIYRNDTTYVDGERMFYGLQLIVNEPTDTTIFRTICEGNQYNFNGQFLTAAGEYRDTLRNASGCDSVVTLHLNIEPKYLHVIERSIYEGDSVEFEGEYYSATGIYPVRLTSSTGCDSIIELRLTVNKLFSDSVSVCQNELPLLWRGKSIYQSGIYRDTVLDSENKQVIEGIKVNVLPIFRAEEPVVISICEGDFYKFGASNLTQQGIYYDTLTAINGCDSIVMLSLQVMPQTYQSENRRIYEGDSVQFNGQWLKESGVYERRSQNANGCTDTYQLILTVLKEFHRDTTATICESDLPFIWHGYEYNATGDYTLPTSWTDSSRVVTTLHLTVNKTFYEERNIAICSGDEFLYKGRTYDTSTEFYDTIPSLVGCDSVIKYIVSVHPTLEYNIEKHISDKEPFDFHGRKLTNSGTYEWTGKTVAGCDSIEHLTLIVHPSFFQSDTIELCQSDSINYPYQWKDENGRLIATISQSGVYNDSVLTEYGFDSVHQVVVHVHPSYFIKEKYEIGEGEILKIHGRDISKPAVYYDTLRTIHGCDSIYHIVINPKTTREFTWNKTICQGDYFDFFGEKKTNTGRYTYTSQYKDSIVYLNLTVNPVSYSEKRIIITDKQSSYIYDGQLYTNLQLGENLFTKALVNQYGCDSIHRIIICVTQRYSDWDPIPLCPGGEVKIDGRIITEAGLYTFERRSRVTGELDSLYRVEVYDAPAFDMPTEKATICQGDSFIFAGKKIMRAGHYDFAMKTINGCDSLMHLDLTVNPSYQFYTDATIADYESYEWRGKSYAQTGNYDISFPTIKDCDSTYTLRLTVIETKRQLTDDTICVGQTYTWRGREIAEEGIYTDTIRQLETGFSAIYTLRLTILHPTTVTSATVGEVCADGEAFDIAFTYSGSKPTAYSVYFDQLAKNEGFQDIINKPFYGEDRLARALVPSKKEVVYLEHTAYVKPNRYTMRLVLDNGVCGLSRSDTLVLLVRYPNWIIEQNWNDVVAPLKSSFNGGYDFAQTDWYVNGVLQPNSSLGYLHNDNLKEGDEVVMVATRKGESFSIPSCPLIIRQAPNAVYPDPILVYPTQAPHHAPNITIAAPQGGRFAIYSSTGMLIKSGDLNTGDTHVTLPGINGIYFIRTAYGDETQTHKVMLY